MRTKLITGALIWLASSSLGFTGQPDPTYTTLVVEYVGEQNRYVPPVVISSSSQEGEWYKQHLWPEPWGGLAATYVVPASVLNEITESPLLKHQLERAKPVDDEPKTLMNVSFTAGVGHDHVQIIVTDQTSAKILKDVAGLVAKYPDLKSELQAIAAQVNPFTFRNVAMGEIEYEAATEAGFRTRGWPHAHFGFTMFKAPNGNALNVYYDDFQNPDEAKRFFDWKANQASQVLWRATLTDADGKPIGYRYRAEFMPPGKRGYSEVIRVVGIAVHWIDLGDLHDAIELEGQYRYSSAECASNTGCR